MRKQVNFFAIEDDYQFLLNAAEAIGMLAIPHITDAKEYDRLGYVNTTKPTAFELVPPRRRFYLYPPDISIVDAIYYDLPKTPHLAALNDASPAIAIGPSYREDDKIFSARIAMFTQKSRGTSAISDEYKAVLRCFNSLARKIRKWERLESERRYIGPYTLEQAKSGQILLARTKSRVLKYVDGEWVVTDLKA